VEGIRCAAMFNAFLAECAARGFRIAPLRALLDSASRYERARLAQARIAGRDGDVCWQESAVVH
jgi:hypothetical protein